MHPLISLLCFIIFAGFISLGHFAVSALGVLILSVVWISCRYAPSLRAWRMLKRMKIFFISIFVFYLWFTPGQLLMPPLNSWSPTVEGLKFGSERILALILLVLAVDSFLSLLSREKILSALYYFFYPLHVLGFDRERFIVRTLLTLEGIHSSSKISSEVSQFSMRNFSAYIDVLGYEIEKRLRLSDSGALSSEVTITIETLPAWYHWLLPAVLAAFFAGVYTW